MELTELSPTAKQVTRRALEYWSEHWDWECPTLFGVEHEELRAVLTAWPSVAPGAEEQTSAAVIGACRELLYGASAIAKDAVQPTIGVTYEEACRILEELCTVMDGLLRDERDA